MKGREWSSPSSRFFFHWWVFEYNHVKSMIINVCDMKFVSCVWLDFLFDEWIWIWIWILWLPLLNNWFYKQSLESMINWWIWMLMGVCMTVCVIWGVRGWDRSFKWALMVKNEDSSFYISVTGCPSCFWVNWRSSARWRGDRHGLQVGFSYWS